MKLSEWAKKQGISYLTAYRWFKDKKLPVKAYQSDSGTIIVQDDSDTSEQSMGNPQSNDVMSVFLKKTVEFSKNNASVEEFAAYVLSNFTLKFISGIDSPKYSRVKPKPEDIRNHFQQFMKPKGEKPKPNMFVTTDPKALDDLMAKSDNLTAQELVEEIHKIGAEGGVSVNPSDTPEVEELMKDISSAMTISAVSLPSSVTTYDEVSTRYSYDDGSLVEGAITRSVDLTPQLNYTDSTGNPAFNNYSFNSSLGAPSNSAAFFVAAPASTGDFKPTQKELQSVNRVIETVEKPRRGRKTHKNSGKL